MSEVCSTGIKALTGEESVVEEDTKSQVEEEQEEKKEDKEEEEQTLESEGWAIFKADGVEFQLNLKQTLEKARKDSGAEHDAEKDDEDDLEHYFIGELGRLKSNACEKTYFN